MAESYLGARRANGANFTLNRHPSVCAIVASLCIALGACTDAAPDPAGAAEPVAIDPNFDVVRDVEYAGKTTDEALLRMLDAQPLDVAARRLVIDSPESAARLSSELPTAFAVQPLSAAGGQALNGCGARSGWREHSNLSRALASFAYLLGRPATARAHGLPFNGTAYLLVVTDASDSALLRVFTDQRTYLAEPQTWRELARGMQPLTLTVLSAMFEQNQLSSDGGPFVGGAVSFRVE